VKAFLCEPPQLIQCGLAVEGSAPLPTQPLALPADVRPTFPIPIAREADGTATPYLCNVQLNALLDEEDPAHYQRVLGQTAQPRCTGTLPLKSASASLTLSSNCGGFCCKTRTAGGQRFQKLHGQGN